MGSNQSGGDIRHRSQDNPRLSPIRLADSCILQQSDSILSVESGNEGGRWMSGNNDNDVV
jgi:hypothetical protein